MDAKALREVFNNLKAVNRTTVEYLVDMFISISSPENLEKNKMTMANLAMVFSPSLLRNPSTDPLQMIVNIKHEVSFVTALFTELARNRSTRELSVVSARDT
mmetsp:Transcript_17190/g.32650  ORF Transcript_17190/g.32650 Transcript_17190/m.32650 type:complete len:102 (+) Transcript_17190:1925-2230(+)